jgi:hypothetical protein
LGCRAEPLVTGQPEVIIASEINELLAVQHETRSLRTTADREAPEQRVLLQAAELCVDPS